MGGLRAFDMGRVNEIIAAATSIPSSSTARSRDRFFADSGDVDGVVCRGSRYLSLIGGVCMSFYDWYCDLPRPARRYGASRRRARIGGLVQLDVHHGMGLERAQTRTPDAHFFTEVRYKGAKTVAVTPDYSKSRSCATCGCTEAGHRCALAMAMGHVILKEFHLEKPSAYFTITCGATATCRCS